MEFYEGRMIGCNASVLVKIVRGLDLGKFDGGVMRHAALQLGIDHSTRDNDLGIKCKAHSIGQPYVKPRDSDAPVGTQIHIVMAPTATAPLHTESGRFSPHRFPVKVE